MLRLMLYKKLQYCLEEEIHGTIWTKQDKHVSNFKAFNRKSQINFFKNLLSSSQRPNLKKILVPNLIKEKCPNPFFAILYNW